MPVTQVALAVALVGALVAAGGLVAQRASGASFGLGRRLAGAREVRVGDLLDAGKLPSRPVRVNGRVRCADPIVTERDDRLVAIHRDVEVRLPRAGWRTIERLRETRTFELWDHDGSLTVDPSAAAEPLIGIPHVWRGSPDELDDSFRAALERIGAEHGTPEAARATTRMVSVVDRLLVLARAERAPDGSVRLAPPPGGYVISALELDAGLRILGGRRGGLLNAGVVAAAVGLLLLAGGLVATIGALLAA